MKFLTEFKKGGYPVLSFDSWEDLAKWGKEKEMDLELQEKHA